MSPGRRRGMVDREHPKLPVVRQCAPLELSPIQVGLVKSHYQGCWHHAIRRLLPGPGVRVVMAPKDSWPLPPQIGFARLG